MNRYTCGVPKEYCNGAEITVNHRQRVQQTIKAHVSPDGAFKCHARYLTKILGFKRVGNREFQENENSPIRVLTKKMRFGGRLRQGKREETQKRGRRVTAEISGGGLIASY